MQNKKLQYITRFDHGSTHGWWVRFKQRDPKLGTQKLFSDAKCGGKRKALAAAVAFRDELLKKHADTRYGMLPGPGRVVKRMRPYLTAGGKTLSYPAWVAVIQVAPNVHVETHWSIKKWGSKEAKARSLAWLERKRVEQLRNYPSLA